MPRWQVKCDACDAGAWIGPRGGEWDAWCEGCQSATAVPAATRVDASAESGPPACPRCGAPLTVAEPRFEELFGELQNLAALLSAWQGDADPLDRILPDRPAFLGDLNPLAPGPEDPPELRRAFTALASGAFGTARARLEQTLAQAPAEAGWQARAWHALGMARQRAGEAAGAEQAFSEAIARDCDLIAARLDRGVLRALRRDWAGARADFERCGDRREARWNRAAVGVLEAVASSPGLPPPQAIAAARVEAGEPSDYWSEHTVGRLLVSALADRARARSAGGRASDADQRVLMDAEHELEFGTFWDRGLVVHTYASLGLRAEAAAAASPLALRMVEQLRDEPAAGGTAGTFLAEALSAAETALREGDPAGALAAVAPLLEREDLRHYRVPCIHCGRGSLGVEALVEQEAEL
jgi:hypothetical protein